MKRVMIIIDGMSDEPIKELGNQTPLEAALIPNIQYMAVNGRLGRLKTTFEGYPIESMVCIMGLIGYEPEKYYPAGRASFEASAKGISLAEDDLIFRCNIVSLDKNKKLLTDFTSGQISDSSARKIINKIKLPHNNWELFPGQSYRNILVIRGAKVNVKKITCYEPHMNIGKQVENMLPYSSDEEIDSLLAQVREFLLSTREQISKMEDVSEPADMLWVWSPSQKAVWPSFKSRTGLSAAFVGGLDFLHGIAMAANIDYELIPGATGYIDTDYSAKAKYALKYIDKYDFVLVHVNATDEEAHLHNYVGKKEAIEKVDKYIVSRIVEKLHKEYPNEHRVILLGDHMTRSIDGKHTDTPVPYLLYGEEPKVKNNLYFNEKNCSDFVPESSLDVISKILK